MIFGTGVDIVEIARIKRSLERYGERFESKVFTKNEIDYCRSKAEPCLHYAGRFAVKEAILKSLGTGMSRGIAWKDMEILNHQETGKPVLTLEGKGKSLFESFELKIIHVSISHNKQFAIAHAIAEK